MKPLTVAGLVFKARRVDALTHTSSYNYKSVVKKEN